MVGRGWALNLGGTRWDVTLGHAGHFPGFITSPVKAANTNNAYLLGFKELTCLT